MGIGPQNLGAAGMNPKSKPCGTPLKMSEDSPILKALVGNQKNLPDHLKKKILAAPEDAKKGNPEGEGPPRLGVEGMDFSEKNESRNVDKYKSTNMNELIPDFDEEEKKSSNTGDAAMGLKSLLTKKDVVPSATRGSMRDYIKRKRDMGKI